VGRTGKAELKKLVDGARLELATSALRTSHENAANRFYDQRLATVLLLNVLTATNLVFMRGFARCCRKNEHKKCHTDSYLFWKPGIASLGDTLNL
jgi:hypothetical protein